MNEAIKHPYFYDDGPDTLEYLLPVRSSNIPELQRFQSVFGVTQVYSGDYLRCWFQNRWQELRCKLSIQIRDRLLLEHSLHSFIVYEGFSWINFKRTDCLESLSEHGNSILVGALDANHFEKQAWMNDFREDVIEYLQYFRTTCGEIPPVKTSWTDPRMLPYRFVVNDDFWNLDENEQHVWDGSLVVRPSNAGSYLLLRKDGQFGHSHLYETVAVSRSGSI